MKIEHTEIGICGLSCRLCPSFHTDGKSRCGGCKSEYRMGAGCPFITCAVKRKEIEFCWVCGESTACSKWRGHREFGEARDTFTCYRKLEDNIVFIRENGLDRFIEDQKAREQRLKEMLKNFNEGRSKRYYCIAATVLSIEELDSALLQAANQSQGMDVKGKAGVLHSLLDNIAMEKGLELKLRK